MLTRQRAIDGFKLALIVALLWSAMLSPGLSMAGGLLLYEVGTADGGYAIGSDGCLPGGGGFLSYSLSPKFNLGFALTGNFGAP